MYLRIDDIGMTLLRRESRKNITWVDPDLLYDYPDFRCDSSLRSEGLHVI